METIEEIIVDAKIYLCGIQVETQVVPKKHLFGEKVYETIIPDASKIFEYINNNIPGAYSQILIKTSFNATFTLKNNIFTQW